MVLLIRFTAIIIFSVLLLNSGVNSEPHDNKNISTGVATATPLLTEYDLGKIFKNSAYRASRDLFTSDNKTAAVNDDWGGSTSGRIGDMVTNGTSQSTTTVTIPSTTPTTVPEQSQEASRYDKILEIVSRNVPYDWRGFGVNIRVGCHPYRCAHGVYDQGTRSIWIGPGAFRSQEYLEYVVTHEFYHGYQDMNGQSLNECEADRGARRWGASGGNYC